MRQTAFASACALERTILKSCYREGTDKTSIGSSAPSAPNFGTPEATQ